MSFILDLLDYGYWFGTPKPFFHSLSRDEAIVLAFLISQRKGLGKKWFFCTAKRVYAEINVDRNAYGRVVKSLTEKGIIQTKREGIPATRYIRIIPEMAQKYWEEGMVKINARMEAMKEEEVLGTQTGDDDE